MLLLPVASCTDVCKLHLCLNPRSHGQLSTWLCPPDPPSNQLADSMVSPVRRDQLCPFLYLFPRLLGLLTDQFFLIFKKTPHTDKHNCTLFIHPSLWTGMNEALGGTNTNQKNGCKNIICWWSLRLWQSQYIYLQLLRITRLKGKERWLILTAYRFKGLERLSAHREQKSYQKSAQENSRKYEEDMTFYLLCHCKEFCSHLLNTTALDTKWSTWTYRF